MTLRVVPIGEQVEHLAYSSSSGTYVLGTSRKADFQLPDDDELHPEWRNEGMFDIFTVESVLINPRHFPIPNDGAKFCQGRQPNDVVCH